MLRGYFARSLHYAAPDGGSSAAGGTTSGGAQTGGEPGSSTAIAPATGQAPAPAPSGVVPISDAPAGDKPVVDKQFSQADVDRMVQGRLEEEKRRELQRTADATKKTKEEALKQAGEWQALAETRQQELATLQTAATQRDRYASALNTVLEAQIADWPDEVKALDPGKEQLEARIAWVASARPLADRLRQAPKAPNTEGGSGNRRPADATTPADAGSTQTYRFQQPGDVRW